MKCACSAARCRAPPAAHPRRQSEWRELQLRSAPARHREDLAGRLPRDVRRAHQSRQQRPRARLRKPRDRFRRSRVPARAAECRGRSPWTSRFKEGKFGTSPRSRPRCTARKTSSRASPAADAQFLGYSRNSKDKLAAPAFKYRVGKNVVEVSTTISERGELAITVSGTLATPQSFALNPQLLKGASVSAGSIAGDRWTLPAGKTNATLRATSPWPARPGARRRLTTRTSASRWSRTPSTATLPAGYSIENYYPPKDNYGRDQLFEALGLSVDEGRHRGRRHAQRRHLAHREWRVAAVRRRPVRQPRRRRRRRQGPRRRRRPEGRAHAHLRHQWRWHRRQIRNAVRRALVSRQLPQLHARPRARARWRLTTSR